MPGLIDERFVTGLVRGYQFLLPQDRGPCLVWAYQDVFQRVLTHYSSVQKWSWCWNSEREVWDLTPTCVSASKSLHKVEFSGCLIHCCVPSTGHPVKAGRVFTFGWVTELGTLPNAIWVARAGHLTSLNFTISLTFRSFEDEARDQALSLWSGRTDSKTLDYQRTNPSGYQIVRIHTKKTTWIKDQASPNNQ